MPSLELSATPTSGRSGRAYRQTVKTAHPDGGGDAEQFGKLQAAYDLLKDPGRRFRVRKHLDRLGRRPETDVLGSMLRARSQSIAEAIKNAEAQIEAIEQAYTMLEGYSYELEAIEVKARAAE
jgi:curved DNA-binding protein CbpA